MALNGRLFIRFNKWRDEEYSRVVYRSLHIKDEIGVSVYDAIKIDGKYHICLPMPHEPSTIDTLTSNLALHDNVYLVSGDVVGTGTDGEPLIKNVKLIKDISDQFEYAKAGNWQEYCDKTHKKMVKMMDEAIARGEKFI